MPCLALHVGDAGAEVVPVKEGGLQGLTAVVEALVALDAALGQMACCLHPICSWSPIEEEKHVKGDQSSYHKLDIVAEDTPPQTRTVRPSSHVMVDRQRVFLYLTACDMTPPAKTNLPSKVRHRELLARQAK